MIGPASLSLFWFLYLGALGVMLPFFSLYLSENAGLSGTEVGLVVAMGPAVGLVAPTVWGQAADRSRSRIRVLAVAIAGATVLTALLAVLRGFVQLALGTAALAAFSTGVIPLGVSVTLAALGENALYTFGRVRVFGTVGFLVLVILFPPLLHRFQAARGLAPLPGGPSEPGLEVMFVVTAVLTGISVLAALLVPERREVDVRSRRGEWLELRRHRPLVRAFCFTLLAFLFLQGPMSLFPLFLHARGGGLEALSRMWILMLLPEIPLIAFSGSVVRRLGSRGLLAAGVMAGGFRWLACGLSSDWRVIYAVQPLHGVTVAGLGLGGALYVDAVVPGRLRSTGQGLNAMAGAGLGAIASNLAAGWLMDHVGTDAPFVAAGVGALVLVSMIPLILPPPRRPEESGLTG